LPTFAKNPLRFYNIDSKLNKYNKPIDIYGIVLSNNDIIAKNYNFTPHINIGDNILAINCGAYSHTFSIRFPYKTPDIIIIDGDNFYKIKEKIF